MDVRTDGHVTIVTTEISRIDRLPYFLSNGAPLAGFARRLRYNGPVIIFKGNGKGPVGLVCVDEIW